MSHGSHTLKVLNVRGGKDETMTDGDGRDHRIGPTDRLASPQQVSGNSAGKLRGRSVKVKNFRRVNQFHEP